MASMHPDFEPGLTTYYVLDGAGDIASIMGLKPEAMEAFERGECRLEEGLRFGHPPPEAVARWRDQQASRMAAWRDESQR